MPASVQQFAILASGAGLAFIAFSATAQPATDERRGPPHGRRPPAAALDACNGLSSGAACTFDDLGEKLEGACFAPQGRPLACRPQFSPLAGVPTTNVASTGQTFSTGGVLCDVTRNVDNPALGQMSNAAWRCAGDKRLLTGNGVPDHEVGAFPNAGNPHRISAQSISASMPTEPALSSTYTRIGGPGGASVYALNSVKFDPGTAGACPDGADRVRDCDLGRGTGRWRIEALGQDVFDFGEDMNNAHVQPSGEYHYHGVPEGVLKSAGVSEATQRMVLVGWATDGFPVYARYCYADAMNAESDVKSCEGSYVLDASPDPGRPSTDWAPLGAFGSDWSYAEGSGDLDECNGRVGVTPEFPEGVYYYMATDDYPYFSRCLKGAVTVDAAASRPNRRRRRPQRR